MSYISSCPLYTLHLFPSTLSTACSAGGVGFFLAIFVCLFPSRRRRSHAVLRCREMREKKNTQERDQRGERSLLPPSAAAGKESAGISPLLLRLSIAMPMPLRRLEQRGIRKRRINAPLTISKQENKKLRTSLQPEFAFLYTLLYRRSCWFPS